MNVLYMHTHDSGRYWQPYGYPVSMPNAMRLAREGLLFRNAFCAAPTCSPSRAALTTGQCAHSSGMLGLAHRGFSLRNSQEHLSAFLGQNGFETVLCGVQHEAAAAEQLPYERILTSPDQKTLGQTARDSANADLAAAFIRQPHDRPFFLSFGMFNTHRPYPDHQTAGLNPDWLTPPWPVADTAENRADMADYYCAAQAVDQCVGKVLRALEESGQMENTLILFTTDHGIAWPHMKCSLYDTGIGVALLLRFPGMQEKQTHATDQLVSQVDLFPTLCDYLGLEKPAWLQGVSLRPVIEQNVPVRDAVFAEVSYHAAYEPKRCVRTERYKLIVRYDDYLGVVAPNTDDSPAKAFLRDAGGMNALLPREELYDLYLDPAERQNRVQDDAYREIYHQLLGRLSTWMEETGDPLLNYRYRIPCPPGAIINIRTDYSPSAMEFEQ